MKTILSILLSVILLTATSCKKETITLQQMLIGKWKYKQSGGGITNQTYYADPAVVKILEFKTDNKYTRTTNGQIESQGSYDIIETKSIFTGKNDNAMRFDPQLDSPKNGFIITLNNNELSLALNAADGGYISYSKL